MINISHLMCALSVFSCCTTNFFLCGLPLHEATVPNCPTQMDVAFAIDASYSVRPYFNQLLQLVKEFAARVSVSEDGFRLSVTQFSSDVRVELYLSNGTSLDVVNRTVDSIKHYAGSTETGLALLTIREQVFNSQHGDRRDAPDLVILVTDGAASDHEAFISESNKLKQSGVTVFAVSIGLLTDLHELKELAGNYVFFSTTQFLDVGNLSESIATRICQVFGSESITTPELKPTTGHSSTTLPSEIQQQIADNDTHTVTTEKTEHLGTTLPREDSQDNSSTPVITTTPDTTSKSPRRIVPTTAPISSTTPPISLVTPHTAPNTPTQTSPLTAQTTPLIVPTTPSIVPTTPPISSATPPISLVTPHTASNTPTQTTPPIAQTTPLIVPTTPSIVPTSPSIVPTAQQIPQTTPHIVQTTSPIPPTTPLIAQATLPSDTKECRITDGVDAVFIIDTSKNVDSSKLSQIKSFLLTFFDSFLLEPTGVHRIGIIQYSDDAVQVLPLDYVNSSQCLQEAVGALQYTGGNSNLAAALNVLESEVLTTGRSGIPRIGVVVTGGLSSTHTSLTRLHASILHHHDVNVFVIGVGEHASRDELSVLASQPKDDHIFTVQNITDANELLSTAKSPLCFGMLNLTRNSTNSTHIVQHRNIPNHSGDRTLINDRVRQSGTVCEDRLAICTGLSQSECVSNKSWTSVHCSKSCGFCLINATSKAENTPACADSVPNCSDYGDYICEDPSYTDWTDGHCPKYCKRCHPDEDSKEALVTHNVNSSSSQNTTSSVDSSTCQDLLPDCENYGGPSVCVNFHAWASVRCRSYCGFCSTINITQPMDGSNVRCPRWVLPPECSMHTVQWSQCPMPSCPEGYILTAVPKT